MDDVTVKYAVTSVPTFVFLKVSCLHVKTSYHQERVDADANSAQRTAPCGSTCSCLSGCVGKVQQCACPAVLSHVNDA